MSNVSESMHTRRGARSECVRARTARAGRLALAPTDVAAMRYLIQCTMVFDHQLDDAVLREGLSGLLDHHPYLAGRIADGDAIAFGEGGVPFSIRANDRESVADFGPSRVDVDAFGDRRRVGRIRRGREPLMTVRLTRLADGCVLAICCSHACFDGVGFFTMLRDWSRVATGRPIDPPVLERPEPPSAARSRAEVAASVRRAGWHRLSVLDGLRYLLWLRLARERVFAGRFSDDALRRCRDACRRESGGARVSVGTAIVAHVSSCLARLLDLDGDEPCSISVVADTRRRLAGRPAGYVGNASTLVTTGAMPASASRGEFAARLHDALRRTLDRSSPLLATREALVDEVLRHRLRFSTVPLGNMLRRRPTHFYANAFANLPIHELDFCGARPVRVVPHNLGDPIVLWPAPPKEGGLELHLGGRLARAVRALPPEDPWWTRLRAFDEPDRPG